MHLCDRGQKSFDQYEVRLGGLVPQADDFPVFLRVVEFLCTGHAGELYQCQPLRFPLALEHLERSAAHEVATAVLRYHGGHEASVLFDSRGVRDVEIHDEICSHALLLSRIWRLHPRIMAAGMPGRTRTSPQSLG